MQQNQQKLNLGMNLDVSDKMLLQLLLKLDYVIDQNKQIAADYVRLKNELAALKEEKKETKDGDKVINMK